MRGFRRASLWTLTRKSNGFRETEISAFAVMPSVRSSRPEVTTVTPVGKRRIAPLNASALGSRTSHPCSSAPRDSSAGTLIPLHAAPHLAPRLLCMVLLYKGAARAQFLRPPALDRLPVGAVPPPVGVAVEEVVEDEGLRTRQQGGLHRHQPVAGHPAVIYQALVSLPGARRCLAVGRSSDHGEVSQARRLVQGAGEELVHPGDRSEVLPLRDHVRGAEGDQARDAPVSRVAAPAVGWVAPDVDPAGDTA